MDFWSILAEWPHWLWVTFFFFVLFYIWGFAYHVAVIFRGWPCEEAPKPPKSKDVEEGEFVVRQGHHEVLIHTCHEPKRVWIALEDDGKYPVCYSDVDKVSAVINADGFVAIVDVSSTERQIRWRAEL